MTNHIRDSIKAECEGRDLTAYALAKLAEMDPGMVKRYFNGDRDLTSENASRLCEVLGLRLKSAKRSKSQNSSSKS